MKVILKFFFLIPLLIVASNIKATNYYLHPELGQDTYAGTSLLHPFKSLKQLESISLQAGDSVLLAAGFTFYGSLVFKEIQGTLGRPIVVASYALSNELEDQRARIDARGYPNGIQLSDCSHIVIKDLIIEANGGGIKPETGSPANMRCGVLVNTGKPGHHIGIVLEHLLIQHIFFEEHNFSRGEEEVRTANGSQNYGWGIRFINTTEGALLKDLRVIDCIIQDVAHTGIKFTGRNKSIHQIKVHGNRVLETGGPGIQMSGVIDGHIKNNYVSHSGSTDDSRKWGRGSGLWTWGSSEIIIENNHFLNANGPGDSAGCHIDFNCNNVIVQYNFSANNAGGFCEILGNNYNCAYRYNISVNDGHRVKGKDGAFQEGKIFWLSGYQGNKNPRKGPFNSYFYNNTIYVSQDIVAKIAVDKAAKGILIANNIFYIAGESKAVLGDQYKPEQAGASTITNAVFQHNVYLRKDNWPEGVLIQDDDRRIADPEFFKGGGLRITDYIPNNVNDIKDKGIRPTPLPGDTLGLFIGLKVSHDILGTPISGRPDIGAIELE